MKCWVNILVENDAYEDEDQMVDAIIQAIEAEGFKALWHKSNPAKE